MTNETDETTETVLLKKRRCYECQHIAVPLNGIGERCANCGSGAYYAYVGTQEAEVTPDVKEQLQEEQPQAIESE